jgi:signal peptide peptidase SppA
MKLLDIMTAPWAIIPEKLHEIRAIYETHMRGDKLDLKGLKQAKKSGLSFTMDAPEEYLRGYSVDRGVAVIPVMDVLTKNRTFFSYLFGGTSMRDIGDAFRNAMNDQDVHSILLHIDSPGGTVDGTEELSNAIKAARGDKPIVTLADGTMASAAYWIGAAADRVMVAGETTQIGSIGVVGTHVDVSKQDEMFGEKWTEITAGKYKRIASMHKPLSDEGKAYLQGQIDEIYTVFVESVADFRGRSVEQILEAADGKVFLGRAAVENGLVDGMATLEDVINQLKEDHEMTIEEFKSKHSELYRMTFDEGRAAGAQEAQEATRTAAFAAGKIEGLNEGAATERDRLTEMDAILIPGHEDLLAECKKDQKCSAADFSIKQAKAEKLVRESELGKLKADAIPPVVHVAAPIPGATAEGGIDNLPLDQRAKAEWEKSPELRKEFGENFDSYLAFQKNVAAGRIRIFGRKE